MGDPQPRKRKEKRKKKDGSSGERSKAEAELLARKLSAAADDSDEGPTVKAPSPPKDDLFNEGDSVIHVHHDGGTGGHWCAKIIFFALLAVLIGLIGLIIIENRGLTDLDTPVAESRYAQVFDGWVDEGPAHDDHHDEHTLDLKHPEEEHDDHDEGFDEAHDEEIEDIESENEHDEHEEEHSDDEEQTDEHDEAESDGEQADDDDEDQDDEVDKAESNEVDQIEGDEDDDDENDHDEIDNDDEDENDAKSEEKDNDDDDDDDDDNDDDDDEADDDNDEDVAENKSEDLNASFHDEDGEEYLVGSLENNLSNENESEENKSAPFEEIDSGEEEQLIDNAAIEEEHLAAKRAEKLAQEKEDNGNVGMRVGVGLALILVAYCVLARKWRNDNGVESVTSQLNRRMTLIPDEIPEVEQQVGEESAEENPESEVEEEKEVEVDEELSSKAREETLQKMNQYLEESEEEIIEEPKKVTKINIEPKPQIIPVTTDVSKDDEEEEEEIEYEEEVEEVEEEIAPIQESEKKPAHEKAAEEEYEDEEVDDEEIEEEELIEDEEIIEEEEIEEDISDDLDDSELMKKLEEKYGKLPDLDDEPEAQSEEEEKPVVPARRKPKPVGGNSVEDEYLEWDGDDDNKDWNQQLDLAQAEMDEGNLEEADRRFTSLSLTKPNCWRAKYGRAKVLDALAEKKRNNNLLKNAIGVYEELLQMKISDKVFVKVAERLVDRITFTGKYLNAVSIQNMLIQRFPKVPKFRNELAILYLIVNKPDLARPILSETLKLWPNDGVALVHHGFILKTVDNNLEEAVKFLQRGIDTREPKALEGRFLFHLGDALARLGHKDKANEIHKLGAELKVFLSPQQRSLYNVDRLKGMPWWKPELTPYTNFIKKLEFHWDKIAQEARQLRPDYEPEQENLKDVGDWSQYELFARGIENKQHCAKCPMTCQIVRSEAAAWGCRRGQVKFSAMIPGTHVFAHTGPTNCRLRAHLGLQGTKDTYIRVGDEIRSWEMGKVLIFDDSFEHEVWHNGTKLRIVLIVDLWHPELTNSERASLPAI